MNQLTIKRIVYHTLALPINPIEFYLNARSKKQIVQFIQPAFVLLSSCFFHSPANEHTRSVSKFKCTQAKNTK